MRSTSLAPDGPTSVRNRSSGPCGSTQRSIEPIAAVDSPGQPLARTISRTRSDQASSPGSIILVEARIRDRNSAALYAASDTHGSRGSDAAAAVSAQGASVWMRTDRENPPLEYCAPSSPARAGSPSERESLPSSARSASTRSAASSIGLGSLRWGWFTREASGDVSRQAVGEGGAPPDLVMMLAKPPSARPYSALAPEVITSISSTASRFRFCPKVPLAGSVILPPSSRYWSPVERAP